MRFPWVSRSPQRRYKPLLQVPFCGHEAWLAAFTARLEAARHGTPQFVALTGPSGSGKSALLEEFGLAHSMQASVLLVRLNAADFLLPEDLYRHLFITLRERSEHILLQVYNDTKRLRKTQGFTWDEKEFCQMLFATDWAQLDAELSTPREATRRQSPLTALLASVLQHPWAVGATTILGTIDRERAVNLSQQNWRERWAALLQAVQPRLPAAKAVLVVVLDQLDAALSLTATPRAEWVEHWQALLTAMAATHFPFLFIWSGTEAGLRPLHDAIPQDLMVTIHQIEPLQATEQQEFLRYVERALPRALHPSWHEMLTGGAAESLTPEHLLFAATCLIVHGQNAADDGLAWSQADEATLVGWLLQRLRRHTPAATALCDQWLAAWAFLPAGKRVHIEELLPLCDLEALGLDPVAGRTGLEKLLGRGVQYGLLTYDPYTSYYTTGSHNVQTILQHLIYTDASERQAVALRRQLAAAIRLGIQQGERAVLAAITPVLERVRRNDSPEVWETMLVAPYRRWLPACGKVERQRMATALGGLRSPLAVALLRLMLHDEEGQIRSGVVQSLTDLQTEETLPVLIEALADTNSDVRWIAVRALGAIAGADAVDVLIPMLNDDDREVGRIAAEGLGRQGDHRAVPHLIAAMRESYPLLRESAALALGELADKRALPALQERLHDTNQQVRRSAEQALARFTTSS